MRIGLQIMTLALLGILLFFSALAVVYKKHESRQLFRELQTLQQEVEQLQEEWSQLLLEQATWVADARVERLARLRLQMVLPEPAQVITLGE